MYGKVAVFLLLLAAVVDSSDEVVKEEIPAQQKPVKLERHGKQDPFTPDGKRNIHFDHEAILGSHKLEEEFDEMEPVEAKYRLSLLAKKMDTNFDGFVSQQELTDWVRMSFRLLDQEEAYEDFAELDQNGDKNLTWPEYLGSLYDYTEEQIEEFRNKNEDERPTSLLLTIDRQHKKFIAADVNQDGNLNRSEYPAYHHPHTYKHMHPFVLNATMEGYDKNKDGLISLDEYLAEEISADDDKAAVITEKENFRLLDQNLDRSLDEKEVADWMTTDYTEEAEVEARYLIEETDVDDDGQLSEYEIVQNADLFVGSSATGHGRQLYYVRLEDEL